jgi:hypothetical protein
MNTTERSRLYSHLTKTRFLHIEDSLERRKLRLFIGSFEQGHGATATAYTFMDIDDARVILNDLSWGKAMNYIDFKGGKDSSGAIVSRTLKITSGPAGLAGEAQERKVWIQVQNGAGEELHEGAIKPLGKPSAEVSIHMTIYQARKMAYACLAYLQAWEVGMWIRSHPDGSLR